ncbi:hypothetical protein GMDG_01728 [Pseudogymnoascus destructans 20631-21]|uniref:Hydrophobin n=1 Tax=Pseudogymnoascus destructans (strain ATCC MYA-4855 / 20631-21) TaxID=658429 RepID=L8FY64_PSED2|nr:hypothetical protein GMDG_01728 [Pseudogymnoascus destructans 20631-21]
MQLTSVVFATSILASTANAWFFPLRPTPWIPISPPPVTSTCTAAISYKPLGSFLFGSLFPNPWAGLGGSVTIPNCNASPAPVCPSGQSCLSTANPCAAGQTCLSSSNPCSVSGQSCLSPPPAHRFPAQQAAANGLCASAGPGLVACLDPTGVATSCCAP